MNIQVNNIIIQYKTVTIIKVLYVQLKLNLKDLTGVLKDNTLVIVQTKQICIKQAV